MENNDNKDMEKEVREQLNETETATVNEADKTADEAEGNKAERQKENGGHRLRRKPSEHKIDELTTKVEEMGNKLSEVNDKYLRLYSEFENFRKRTNKEKADLILNGGKDVIKLMLPVIDDMERALANMADNDTAKEGMQLILKNLMTALQQKGLKPMEAMGVKFDDKFHEAITQIPAQTPEAKGTVIDVVKKGYFLNEEVIRFAQVVVAN